MSACGHYPSRHSLHAPNFRGAIEALTECIYTISGVGTNSFTIDPSGYSWNFEGLVQVIEDLNWTLSGISTSPSSSLIPGSGLYTTPSGSYTIINTALAGGSGIYITDSGNYNVIHSSNLANPIVAGSGIYATPSGAYTILNTAITDGSGIYITESGNFYVVNTNVFSTSGVPFTAGSGLYLSDGGTRFNLGAYGEGTTSVLYNGGAVAISGTATQPSTVVTVSGAPASGYTDGSLWFDINQGRLFVYASGNGVSDPDWYQTNAEALAIKSDMPPSGAGYNAPPRDGALWFNNLLGSLFIYDATTSGWYQTSAPQTLSVGASSPPPPQQPALWYDTSVTQLKIWDGANWVLA